MINRLFLLVIILGALGLGLFWLSGVIDERADAAYAAGKAECKAEYNQVTIKTNSEITAKTQEILKYKNLLKEKRKGMSDDCQAIYNIDLSVCRQQLRNKAGG